MYVIPLLLLVLLGLIVVYAYIELNKPKKEDKYIWVGFGDDPFRK